MTDPITWLAHRWVYGETPAVTQHETLELAERMHRAGRVAGAAEVLALVAEGTGLDKVERARISWELPPVTPVSGEQ